MSHGNLTQAPQMSLDKKKKKSYDFKIINLKNICIIKNTVR
jgi:hypothetical protein